MTKTNPKVLLLKNKPKDFPFDEVSAQMQKHAFLGMFCYQKFTCAGCGNRLTMDKPNTLFRTGTCDNCDVTTTITHCNFLLSTGPLK